MYQRHRTEPNRNNPPPITLRRAREILDHHIINLVIRRRRRAHRNRNPVVRAPRALERGVVRLPSPIRRAVGAHRRGALSPGVIESDRPLVLLRRLGEDVVDADAVVDPDAGAAELLLERETDVAGVRVRGQPQVAVEGVVAAAVGAAGGGDGSGDLADLVVHGPRAQAAGFKARILEEGGGAGGGDRGGGGGRCRCCGGCY